jgi:hypothetical protein
MRDALTMKKPAPKEENYKENARLLHKAFGVAVVAPAKAGDSYILKTGEENLARVMNALKPYSRTVKSPF